MGSIEQNEPKAPNPACRSRVRARETTLSLSVSRRDDCVLSYGLKTPVDGVLERKGRRMPLTNGFSGGHGTRYVRGRGVRDGLQLNAAG